MYTNEHWKFNKLRKEREIGGYDILHKRGFKESLVAAFSIFTQTNVKARRKKWKQTLALLDLPSNSLSAK